MTIDRYTLTEQQLGKLNELLAELNQSQKIWLSGYLNGLLGRENISGEATAVPVLQPEISEPVANLTILFGTETGNSQELAEKLAGKAGFKNIKAKVVSMYDYDLASLVTEDNLAVIVSTHGEGEVPEMAKDFVEFIKGNQAPTLENVSYSVLALGDKTYKHFCKTGEDVNQALKDLGAFSIVPIQKCDVDYEIPAEIWMNNFLMNLTPAAAGALEGKSDEDKEYSKTNPFYATVKTKTKLTGEKSDKEVYHFELSLEGSGLNYEPGDAVGIFTRNPEELVTKIIETGGFDSEHRVFIKDGQTSLKDALTHHVEITVLSFDLLDKYHQITQNEELDKILDDDSLLDAYIDGRDLLDLLEDFPYDWNENKLIEILRPIPPRLYSISSSQEAVGEEVHATISLVKYEKDKRLRVGACTSHVIFTVEPGDKLPVYIDKNPSFKLPKNNSAIIMVGAGTGVAPYRAFMQQRSKQGYTGYSWLFYGDRHSESDFLYKDEWENLLENESLERMDVAFSRDQEEKVYVQHKLIENQEEIFEWIENGAHFYICGDMKHMAKDVNKTLLDIIQTQGGIDEEQAEKYLRMLKKDKRYQTDVY